MTTYVILKYGLACFAAGSLVSVGLRGIIKGRLGIFSWILLGSIASGLFVLVDSHYIEPNWIKVEKVVIKDSELAGIVGNTRIVHIADIHLTDGIGYREEKLVKKVNKLKPDILFFSGDLIDDLSQVGPAVELLRRFEVKIGIFAVPGNTDHIVMDSESLKRTLMPAGINLLVNETRRLRLPNGNVLWVVGVDDPKYKHAKLDQALAGIPRNVPKIMLAHAPNIFDRAVRERINLVLVGDTHGGQVGIDFLIRMSDYANRTPYMRGLFKEGRTQMYVNRGIGMKTLPIRFLCRPEISVIEVRD